MKRLLPLLLLPALALADGPRAITVSSVTRSGEEIASVQLAFGAGRSGWTFDLVAMSGGADFGDDLAAWARTNVVATIGPNDSSYTWTAPAGFWDDATCLRFALVPKSGMPYDNRCEYVTVSHGTSYWIDTGFRGTSKEDSYRLETDQSFTQTTWFGADYYLQLNAGLLSSPATKSHIVISYNEAGDYALHCYQNGNLISGAERNWSNASTPSSVMLAMWALGSNDSNAAGGCNGSIWTWKVWKNGELVSDIVPVVVDGNPRVFDRMTGEILFSSHFNLWPDERGPDVAEPPDATSELLQVIHSDAPIFAGAISVTDVLGTSATLSGVLTSFGGDAADCTLAVLLGTQADLSDAVQVATGAPDASGAFSFDLAALDPDTAYYAAVVATGGEGGTTRSGAASFTTLGAWSVDSISFSTSQRTATFSIDAVQGAGDATFTLLFTDGQVAKTNVVRSAGGTFDLVWDSADDASILWDESYEWRIRVESECAGSSWSQVYAYTQFGWRTVTFEDTAAYLWTGAGATAGWTDAGNWELLPPATAGKGYPNHNCTAVFGAGATADVELDVDVSIGALDISGAGASVSLRPSESAPGATIDIWNFSFGSQTGAALGSVFAIHGVETAFKYNVPIGNGNALVLDDGATVTMDGRSQWNYALWLAAENATAPDYCGRVEVRNGSTLVNETAEGIALGGQGTLLVSNATVRATTYLHPNAYTLGGRVRLEGATPVLEVAGVLRGWNGSFTGATNGVIEFCVPKKGWTNAPVRYVTDTRNGYAVPLGGSDDASVVYGGPNALPIRLRIAEDSPAFYTGTTETPLVSWAPGVNPARVFLDAMPKPAKDAWLSAAAADAPYAWTEVSDWTAETAMPLAMGARLVGVNGTLILVK